MKALSIRQPWASLVVHGIKKMDTRGWTSRHRGLLGIQASNRMDSEGVHLCFRVGIRERLMALGYKSPDDLPRGVLVGTVELLDIRHSEEVDLDTLSIEERLLGNFKPNRYVWILGDPKPYAKPLVCRGYTGVFPVAEEVFRNA